MNPKTDPLPQQSHLESSLPTEIHLPPEIHGFAVTRDETGAATYAVTKRNAARLMSWTEHRVQQAINDGQVDVCRHPETNEHLLLVDSLWELAMKEHQRG